MRKGSLLNNGKVVVTLCLRKTVLDAVRGVVTEFKQFDRGESISLYAENALINHLEKEGNFEIRSIVERERSLYEKDK